MGLWDKIAGAARWFVDGAKNIVGRVNSAINTGRDVVGKVTSVPGVGDLIKTGWSMVPGSGVVDNVINRTQDAAKLIGSGLNTASDVIDKADSVLGKRYR